MNRWIGIGRITGDPETRYSTGERSIAISRYTLAVDRKGKKSQNNGEQTADFIRCVAFDRAGEFAEKYFRKGMRVAVSGRIQTGSYTNRDGVKVYTTEIIVEEQEFADSKRDGNQSTSYQGEHQRENRSEPKTASEAHYEQEDFMNIPDNLDDSGLPFN